MENQNELFRMLSQALQNSNLINEEILKILQTIPGPTNQLENLRQQVTQNKALLKLIADATPIE